MNRKCKNSPDRFCYVCGKVTFSDQQCTIKPLVKFLYNAYFGIKLGDQDKTFAPHMCCKACIIALRRWSERAKRTVCHLVYLWCGEKARTILQTVIFA